MDEPFWRGAIGGVIAVAVAFLPSLSVLATAARREVLTALAALAVNAALYGAIGGAVAWGFEGRAGDMLAGLTAVGLIGVLLRSANAGIHES